MSFCEDLNDMIDNNYEPSSWQSCGQADEISEDTRFVVATTMPNTGLMCGGDGCVFGEWAWFNDVDDLIDYVTRYIIPFELCDLEEQDPRVVILGDGDAHIFDLPFAEKHIPIKDELQRLWNKLQALKGKGATYEQVKAALLESDKRSREIDGELVFGFMVFDNYRDACAEVLSQMNPLDENRKGVETILKRELITPDANEFLKRLFSDYSIE